MDELEIEKYLRLRGRISVFAPVKMGSGPWPAMKEILLFIQQ